jgi:hypothetical protein
VDDLAGRPLLMPRRDEYVVEVDYISWHHERVFKRADAA